MTNITWIDAIGVIGSLLTIVGIAFTVQQLRRTAKATEAVKSAVNLLKNRMAAFDYASECVRAGRSLQHVNQLLKLKQWSDAAATLVEVQTALHRISISGEGSSESRKEVGLAAEQFLEAVIALEEAADKSIDFSASGLVTSIRKLINLLDSEFIGVNRDMYENG